MTLVQGIALLDFARKVIAGDVNNPKEIARSLVGLALDLVPVEDLQEYLTDAARIRADNIADTLQAIKVGS
jgi:hypothetical protein